MDTDGDGLFDRKGGQGVLVKLETDTSQDLFDGFKRLLAYIDVPAGARGQGLISTRTSVPLRPQCPQRFVSRGSPRERIHPSAV